VSSRSLGGCRPTGDALRRGKQGSELTMLTDARRCRGAARRRDRRGLVGSLSLESSAIVGGLPSLMPEPCAGVALCGVSASVCREHLRACAQMFTGGLSRFIVRLLRDDAGH
jgi:hypothetical protein